MKKLFLKVLILLLPVIVPAIIIILLPLPSDSYPLASIDKHRLLENTETPRIVLVGGSNLAFGIDSSLVQNAFNIPVINTAVQMGIGLGRMLDDLAPRLNSGDILLIVPEYEHFESAWNGSDAAYYLIFDAHQYRTLLNPHIYGFPTGISSYLRNKVPAMIRHHPNLFGHTRYGFNEYGDYVKHLTMENRQFTSPKKPLKNLEVHYLARFFALVDAFTVRGIRVLVSYPSLEEGAFLASETFIGELDAALRSGAVTVISNPRDYAFPRCYFYDSIYHLNAKGRELRTARLIRDLARYLGDARVSAVNFQ
jgi:hypothetical protein